MKILIVGLGSIGKKHLSVLKPLAPTAEIFALRSSNKHAKINGVQDIYSIEDLPSTLTFAIISNPTYLHFETIKALLPMNIPLLIEKPLAHSVKDAIQIVKNTPKELISMISCNLRFHPCIIYLREQIKNMDWIEINSYCGSYLPEWRPDSDYTQSYSAKREYGGGVDLDLIHEIDYLYSLLGKPEKITSVKKNISRLNINAPDYSNYILEYEKGVVSIILNYYRRTPRRTIEVITKDDVLNIDLLEYSIFSEVQNKTIFSERIDRIELLKRQMKYFLTCLKNNEQTINPISVAHDVLKLCLENEKA